MSLPVSDYDLDDYAGEGRRVAGRVAQLGERSPGGWALRCVDCDVLALFVSPLSIVELPFRCACCSRQLRRV